jgi:polar amino acid transport system substrate-binding protein
MSMSHQRRIGTLAAAAASAALLVSPVASLAQDASAAPMASEAAAASPAPGASGVSEACQAANLGDALKSPGRLTISTDNPAFFPWFSGTVPEGSEWASFGGFPPSGEGFEGALAYAIAEALGFSADQVDWIGQAAFGLAFAPGEKDFDFHLAQVSILPERAEAVDFSDPYFDVQQAIVALSGSPITEVTSLAELKEFQLGAAVGTTSLIVAEEVIQPSSEIQVYDDNTAGKTALENGQIDGLVVDTPTAFYIRDAELENFDTPEQEGAVVGQIITENPEQFGLVLGKDSPLTVCVNEALAAVRASGQHQEIYDTWIREANDAPDLQ